MMTSENIIIVSEADFEYEVLAYSQNIPVVVDFWASWCIPCKVLTPTLEKVARDGQGTFRLAKVDVDENANLARRYNVRNIPTVKAFQNGSLVSEFSGVLPEGAVRDFIRRLAPSPTDLLLEKGLSLVKLSKWAQAEAALSEFLESSPEHPAALYGLAKSMLAQGRAKDALKILRNFPASREFNLAEILRPLAEAVIEHEAREAQGSRDIDQAPLEAAYDRCLRLARRGNTYAALDGFLDVLRQNKRYRGGQVKAVVLAYLEILGEDDPQTRQYRTELASILF